MLFAVAVSFELDAAARTRLDVPADPPLYGLVRLPLEFGIDLERDTGADRCAFACDGRRGVVAMMCAMSGLLAPSLRARGCGASSSVESRARS